MKLRSVKRSYFQPSFACKLEDERALPCGPAETALEDGTRRGPKATGSPSSHGSPKLTARAEDG